MQRTDHPASPQPPLVHPGVGMGADIVEREPALTRVAHDKLVTVYLKALHPALGDLGDRGDSMPDLAHALIDLLAGPQMWVIAVDLSGALPTHLIR